MKKENLPKITVITTTFNLSADHREPFFEKCCESVHNQTYPNIEHIVEDGASKDGSLDLIRKYENKGWLKCYSEPDKGIDDGYNKALSHATGKYVFFMNSDDQYYANDVLEKCVELMEKENADYCYGTERQYDREGNFTFEWKPNLAIFWHNVPYPHATLGVRRDVLAKLGNYNTDCGYGGDYYLMIQLILEGYKGIEIPTVISRYILGGISSQNEDKAKQYRTFFILAKRIHYIMKQFCPEITEEDCFNIYTSFGKNINELPKNFLVKFIKFMLNKKLKYFDYNSFIDYINGLVKPRLHHKQEMYYLFSFLPIMKVKLLRSGGKEFRLFGLIPLLKIKNK